MPLGDKEVSGTPLETRGATENLGQILQNFFRNPGQSQGLPFGRQRSEALGGTFGFDVGDLDIEGALRSALGDPADVTSGLFEALEPFERRETERQVAGLREMFGTLGGRFGRNVGQAEASTRAELAEGFARNRAQQTIPAMLQATGQRNQAISSLLQALQGGAAIESQSLGQILQFLSPGGPNIQQGAISNILGGAGAAAGAFV